MKVAHIAPSFFPARIYGGPTETVYQLCRATAAAGCQVRVLTTNANGPQEVLPLASNVETPLQENLTVQYCARQWPESISSSLLWRLGAYIRWADVVHLEAVYSFPTMPVLWLSRRYGKPVIWSARGALARWKGARHPYAKSLYNRLCNVLRGNRVRFHFTSEPERAASLKQFGALEADVIPNGVDCPEKVHHVPHLDKLRLLYLGRLDPIKGVENLLEACGQLETPLQEKWQLTIAGGGDGNYRAKLQSRIEHLGLARSVRMIGPVQGQSKEDAFSRADVVVVPSYLENFCMVVAEALAREVPVIAGKGVPWPCLESKDSGLWVDNDPSSLARAIERMSRMPMTQMGEKGRVWMQSEFSWDRVAAQMIQVYERSLKEV